MELTTYNPMLIERREQMADPRLMKALNSQEIAVFKATTSQPISARPMNEMLTASLMVLNAVADELGIERRDEMKWQQKVLRLTSIIKTYYPTFTPEDIELAFELLAVGALDNYLPKDYNGVPDKKHYGNLTTEYFARVLNAYRCERDRVIIKAANACPKSKEMSDEERAQRRENCRTETIRYFNEYQNEGKLFDGGTLIDERIAHEFMMKCGLADPVEETPEETMRAAVFNTPSKAGLRRKEIRKAFDAIIQKKLNIQELI